MLPPSALSLHGQASCGQTPAQIPIQLECHFETSPQPPPHTHTQISSRLFAQEGSTPQLLGKQPCCQGQRCARENLGGTQQGLRIEAETALPMPSCNFNTSYGHEAKNLSSVHEVSTRHCRSWLLLPRLAVRQLAFCPTATEHQKDLLHSKDPRLPLLCNCPEFPCPERQLLPLTFTTVKTRKTIKTSVYLVGSRRPLRLKWSKVNIAPICRPPVCIISKARNFITGRSTGSMQENEDSLNSAKQKEKKI